MYLVWKEPTQFKLNGAEFYVFVGFNWIRIQYSKELEPIHVQVRLFCNKCPFTVLGLVTFAANYRNQISYWINHCYLNDGPSADIQHSFEECTLL